VNEFGVATSRQVVFLHQMPKHGAIRSRPVRDLHQTPSFDDQARFLAGLIHLMPDRPAGGVIDRPAA
jgi:hypothetical protein